MTLRLGVVESPFGVMLAVKPPPGENNP